MSELRQSYKRMSNRLITENHYRKYMLEKKTKKVVHDSRRRLDSSKITEG